MTIPSNKTTVTFTIEPGVPRLFVPVEGEPVCITHTEANAHGSGLTDTYGIEECLTVVGFAITSPTEAIPLYDVRLSSDEHNQTGFVCIGVTPGGFPGCTCSITYMKIDNHGHV